MPPLPITSGLAVLAALGLVALSLPVTARRFRAKVSLGEGGDALLQKRVRVQANFVEYVPLALIVIGLAEGAAAPDWLLWTTAAMLVVGRIAHAIGMYLPTPNLPRAGGMILTWSALVVAAMGLALTLV
ncbi:MAPEG family protein [Phenylobacterium sp.]|jgi:uncharacterized membrane protein YecN with MAPEG domain|uniref:MAPEG family protein n=1 Tax=Phenylobacterium sp. TaxID=1871053 RepID=UPI002F94A330